VAIKQLRRRAIEPPRQGGEDPYAEISVMQAYGDDRHVRCCEALRDANNLYIVTLQAGDGDLFDQIRWVLGGGFAPRDQVARVARQLVKNLEHLQIHKLVHRDLKPENVLVEEYPWLPIIDCAMTLKLPYLEGRPQKIVPQGVAGSPCYISPEVLFNQPFDHKADVWAFGIILLNLLTGMRFWDFPLEGDENFNFFVLHGGLENEALGNRRLEELIQIGGEESFLSRCIQAVQVLDPVARNLLQALLSPDPQNRPELDEIINHPFFHGV
jgi:serine/threonine protein kinase